MTRALGDRWRADPEFQEHVLEEVRRSGGGYELHQDGGLVLYIDDPGWEPRPGDTARFFGRGLGYPVRGVVIFPKSGGMPRVARYQTAAEAEAEAQRRSEDERARKRARAESERSVNDARIAALPEPFKRRIERFRAGNPEFWWDFQPYELFCCEEAVRIAKALKDRPGGVRGFAGLSWEQQKAIVPGLGDGHSGNTFSMSVRLAHWYLTNPDNVVREHGALTPLVGCQAYGCTHAGQAVRS